MIIFTSSLPNDTDMIHSLGSCAVPILNCPTDCFFFGVPDALIIGVERKKIGDMVSCISNGRYLYQAQLAKEAGINVLSLIVEGETRANPDDGLLEIKSWGFNSRHHWAEIWKPVQPAITYSRFDQYLTELDYLAGIVVKRSGCVQETVSIIKALYTNFQTPPDGHNSLHQIFSQPERMQLTRPGIVQRVAKELSCVGWSRSRDVAGHFKTVRAMVEAGEKEWMKIGGIGKGIAGKVVREINGLPLDK